MVYTQLYVLCADPFLNRAYFFLCRQLLLAVVGIVAGIIQTIWSYELQSFLKLDDTRAVNTLQSAASLACNLLIATYLCLLLNEQHHRNSIAGMLRMAAVYQVPIVGADICGYTADTTNILCSRWAMLGAFYPFMRNHNPDTLISQEFYRRALTTQAAQNVLDIRYRLLDYFYTAFHEASLQGTPVSRTFAPAALTRHADRLRELEADDPPLEPRPALAFTQEGSSRIEQEPRGLDKGCARDLPQPKKLGVNAIRAYSIDSRLNHVLCRATLSGAGIYVILDLTSSLNGSIDATQPTNLLDQYIKIIDVFSIYDNIPVFHVGNEVLTADATNAAPFLKAMARDIKAYLTSISSTVLVSYADIDGASSFRDAVPPTFRATRAVRARFALNTSIDLFGLNNCSEFGSENCSPSLSAFSLTDVWSGGLAFSYSGTSAAETGGGPVARLATR
ncbi:glycosyl hydrolases family 31-domain-containing protein [Mycena albidolilacea]|uniref:1,3-beta-glucanosyltransferase n=1 Tax=Mycena albidolilacea TaxID=1033008 RepID=A0AAD6ZBW7_9AGAR|nr:glycosyl hydrolases family 31-domain-containing protein [Mycena albidolilacea]